MFNETKYLSKMIDIRVFIRDMENFITDDFASSKAVSLIDGVEEMLSDPKLWVDKKIPSKEKIKSISEKIYKTGYAKTKNYKKWVLGYGLVMSCGVFDNFLLDLLKDILETNDKFTQWVPKEEILSKFERGTIKDKYRIFINKLNFSETELFDFSSFNHPIKMKFNGVNFNDLNKIYKERNKVAHTDSYIISSIDDLFNRIELLEKLMWNLSIKCWSKWNIKSEMIEMAKNQK